MLFYLSESITFEGQVPIWRVSGAAETRQKCSWRGAKKRGRKNIENHKKTEKVQKTDPHEVWYIPHGFDVFTFCNVNKYRTNMVEKLAFLMSGADFGHPKGMAK